MTPTPVTLGLSDRHQLSPMQRPLLMSQHLHPDAPLQNMALVSQFQGSVDKNRLAEAFDVVVQSSDTLRTQIVEGDLGFEAKIRRDAPTSEHVDLPKAALQDWVHKRVSNVIDTTQCCYDSVIFTHEDQSVSWYLNLHHTVTDAASSALLVSLTAAVYNGFDIDVSSYYRWTKGLDQTDKKSVRALRHWQDRKPAPRIGRLYTSRPAIGSPVGVAAMGDGSRSSRLTFTDQKLLSTIESRLADSFTSLNEELGWTTVLMTALAVYLHKTTRSKEFSIGLPVHNRSDEETKSLIGPAMEVFPVDIRIEQGDSLKSVHRRVGKSIIKTLANAVAGTAPKADYEAVLNVILRAGIDTFGTIPITTTWVDSGAIDSEHMVRLQLTRYAESGYTLQADLNHGVADLEQRGRFWGHFSSVLQNMADDPSTTIDELEIVTTDEVEVISDWEHQPEEPVVDIVDQLRAGLVGSNSVALEDDHQSWTGDELWEVVAAGADYLGRKNIGVGDRVAVEMPRTAGAVQAILSVLLSGAAYVPIDPKQPSERRQALADIADCKLVIKEALPIETAEGSSIVHQVDQKATKQDEAYVLFTSGSTGEPKGVPITRHGLSRYISFAKSRYRVSGDEPLVVPFFSSLTFDLTVTSLFLPLVSGGRLIVIEADGSPALQAIASRPEINWCKATPSHLEILMRLLPPSHGLKTYVVGGEAFNSSLARRLFEHNVDAAIYNEYGPTEAVVGCMIHQSTLDEVAISSEVPIGVPASGATLRIVDEGLARVPIGSPGELLISHPGLTSGYLQSSTSDDSQQRSFVELDGQRFYHSGDLVRLKNDTTAVYLGRIDEQIKIGGIRLEPTEVEAALESHPDIRRAAVRLWQPKPETVDVHCQRCGLPSNVPGVSFDSNEICSTCHEFDRVAPIAESWFKTPVDLIERRDNAQRRQTGKYDSLVLLSGGKDSTFALYKLVELGFTPYALTLDNGFISEGAKDNVRRSVKDLGIDHEFATSDSMNAVFRESLAQFSNVCHGCYKTIYSLATHRAVELGIPMIVTGLSRGQLFETRLIPQQFDEQRFDPDTIDRAVIEARKNYHRSDDKINRLLDTSVFETDDVFEQVEYLDIYRYLDIELEDMLDYLGSQAPWVRPADTGRSTNCLINAAGIFTHQQEQGYHNYAEPYAWDVRLGHKTRSEAMEELNDGLDLEEVSSMLATIGYEPRDRSILTAWLEVDEETTLSPSELNSYLSDRLPIHAIPAAFVTQTALPVTTNGKLDIDSLPAPERLHRAGPAMYVSPESETEQTIVSVWERVLRLQPIGLDDDFFVLGGDSLAALETASVLEEELGFRIDDAVVFMHPTPRQLAQKIEAAVPQKPLTETDVFRPDIDVEPALSEAEQGILYDVALDGESVKYNLGRRYKFEGVIDVVKLEQALQQVAVRHEPLHWTYENPRRKLTGPEAVEVLVGNRDGSTFHRQPFDLTNGPLLRCWVQTTETSTAVVLAFHHVSADSETFDIVWSEVTTLMGGGSLPALTNTYSAEMGRIRNSDETRETDKTFWLTTATESAASIIITPPSSPGPDGFLRRLASVSVNDISKNTSGSGSVLTATAAALTVSRYVDDEHQPVGLGFLASARQRRSAEGLAGYFLNALPLQFHLDAATSVHDTIRQVRDQLGHALAHRSYPYARMVQDRRVGLASVQPFEVLVAYDQLGTVSTVGFDGNTILGSQQVLHNGTAVGPASLFVEVGESSVELALEFSGAVMSVEDAANLLADFDVMLSAVVAASVDQPDVELAVTSPSLLVGAEQSTPASVWSAISGHLTDSAAATAIESDGEALTWSQVDRLSSAVARRLKEVGVVAGDRVVVALHRSTMVLPAIVAIARLGATYVPIDPTYPTQRKTVLAYQADAVAALVDDVAGNEPLTPHDIAIKSVSRGASGDPIGWDDRAFDPEHVAYIIFTSGSTGEPKGVPVTNGRLAASTAARFEFYQQLNGSSRRGDRPTRFLLLSSISFDSSIAGLFWTASAGGTIVIPTDDDVHNVDTLGEYFSTQSISHTLLVPTLYESVLNRRPVSEGWPEHIIVAGESCASRLVSAHKAKASSSSLTNEYGPTEATVWASAAVLYDPDDASEEVCSVGGVVPIGRPVAGVSLAVVDHNLRPVPCGVEGQLVVGGSGVVDGYLQSDIQRDDSFVSVAWAQTAFLTGDLAVVVNGSVRFLGRTDDQLSVNGVRVEPGEIESALMGIEGIETAAVCVVDLRTADELLQAVSDDEVRAAMIEASSAVNAANAFRQRLVTASGVTRPTLVAHLELSDGAALDVGAVRRNLAAELATNVVPQRFVVQSQIPRLPNGKIDRASIPQLPTTPADRSAADRSAADRSLAETGTSPDDVLTGEIVDVFSQVIGVSEFGADESFFDIGGHSLLAVELVDRIENQYQTELPISVLYKNPSAVDLARFLSAESNRMDRVADRTVTRSEKFSTTYLVPIQPEGTKTPIIGVHVLGINSEFYRPLSARLGPDQPMYGVGQPVADLDTSSPSDVAEIAAEYRRELEPITSVGPVILAAVSLGSVVAYELAAQLRIAGREVEKLVLFDAAGPMQLPGSNPGVTAGLRAVVNKVAAHGKELAKNPPKYVLDRSKMTVKRLSRRREMVSIGTRRRLGIGLSNQLEIRRFVEDNVRSQVNYEFEPLLVPMLVFKADDSFTAARKVGAFGWEGVAAAGVTLVDVVGGHLSMLAEPHVEKLGSYLADELAAKPASSQLVGALHRGDFVRVLRRLASTDIDDPFESEVVRHAMAETKQIADAARYSQESALLALLEAGVGAVSQPVAKQLIHHTFTVSLSGAVTADTLHKVLLAFQKVGFHPQLSLSVQERLAEVVQSGHVVFVAEDTHATRAVLRWETGRGSSVKPEQASSVSGDADLGVFVGTPSALVSDILGFADVSQEDVIVDIGCGDGRVLIEAAERFKCRGLGIEQNSDLVDLGRRRVNEAGLGGLVEIMCGDAKEVDFSSASVIFLFLPPEVSSALLPDLLDQRSEGAVIIAHEQLSVAWPVEPTEQHLVVNGGVTVAYLWR